MFAWFGRSLSIEAMAVAVEAIAAPVTVPALSAAPGRSTAEPDVPVGRSELALFELPALGDAPEPGARIFVTAANTGLWKPLPVEIALGGSPLASVAIRRRAILGAAETVLDERAPAILDDLSSVVVRLRNPAHYLLNADPAALMAGSNLAMLGDELIQFGRAEQLHEGLYRLSNLLRGRRGTEWASGAHYVGEPFCLAELAAMRTIELEASALGAGLIATAHGVGDVAPLPEFERVVTGESMKPPPPCHLKLWRDGSTVTVVWVRRSHRGWAWVDGIGVADDPFPQLYRLILSGPGGTIAVESELPSKSFELAELPADEGEIITVSVATVGLALSHAVSATLTL
jgi:hypothetical protein